MACDAPPQQIRPDSGDHVVFDRTRGVTIELDVLQSFDTLVLASYWFTSPQRRNSGTPGPGKVDERKETRNKQTNLRVTPSLAAPKRYRGYVVKSGSRDLLLFTQRQYSFTHSHSLIKPEFKVFTLAEEA